MTERLEALLIVIALLLILHFVMHRRARDGMTPQETQQQRRERLRKEMDAVHIPMLFGYLIVLFGPMTGCLP